MDTAMDVAGLLHGYSRHILCAGTSLLQHEADNLAVVWRTGSATSKGELLRNVVSYERDTFSFDIEVGVVLLNRYCCASRAGKVTHAFFDKTGTLTKQGLDFLKARSLTGRTELNDRLLQYTMAVCHSLTPSSDGRLIGNPVDHAMFCASGASLVSSSLQTGTVVQDKSGEKLAIVRHFEFDHHRMTQSVVVQVGSTDDQTKYFAIAKGSGESVKGLCLPNTMPVNFAKELLHSARTGIYQISAAYKALPPGTDRAAVANMSREDLESDLNFLGVLDFQNVLRPETEEVIRQLSAGGVVSSMWVSNAQELTGILRIRISHFVFDAQVWTTEGGRIAQAPSTGKLKRGEVQLALSGKAWAYMIDNQPSLAKSLAPHIRVFGRCTPHDKVTVIRTMVESGKITLMCGDGGNDTGALKAAHVGVALSDAEASMVAPFASLDKDIRSVLDVLKEGRCALASALATYKYMIMYGQVETINQIVNAYFQITFSEWCWVFMDGIWTIAMAFTLPLAKPHERLADTFPTSSILGLHTLSSALGVFLLNFFFTVLAITFLSHQDWYLCRQWTNTDVSNADVIGDNFESEVIFLVTGYQYISSAMAFNFGYEFRQGWTMNRVFVAAVAVFSFLHFYAALVPGYISCFWRVNCDDEHTVLSVTSLEHTPIQNPYHTTVMPLRFRWTVVAIMIINTITTMGYEYILNRFRRQYSHHGSSVWQASTSRDDFETLPAHGAIAV
eukprot:scaffold2222_cov164-Amphora_coffeaeformis.AAC.7